MPSKVARPTKFRLRGRLDHAHRMARLDGEPDQLNGLVGSDPPADPDKHPRHLLTPAASR